MGSCSTTWSGSATRGAYRTRPTGAKLILSTDRGVEALDVAFAAIRELERKLAQRLGEETVAELNRTLARIVETD
ncbi:hypothetical protein AB0K15_20530 [Amycolatopsis sp. NPDC049253]|uniref:hypothetical protein n=1 Tax=Amycolatopsis sp. NPDC049253 TaxID=3155274 RepID=UPI00342B35B6